jgi:hypothetical protein
MDTPLSFTPPSTTFGYISRLNLAGSLKPDFLEQMAEYFGDGE